MRLLIHTASLVVVAILLFLLVGRAADQEARTQELQTRVLQLEIQACGFEQFEDYSVIVQVMDWARESCVAEIRK